MLIVVYSLKRGVYHCLLFSGGVHRCGIRVVAGELNALRTAIRAEVVVVHTYMYGVVQAECTGAKVSFLRDVMPESPLLRRNPKPSDYGRA